MNTDDFKKGRAKAICIEYVGTTVSVEYISPTELFIVPYNGPTIF